MEVLSPRSANLPMNTGPIMKKTRTEYKLKKDEKPTNPDRIDEAWKPPPTVTEPGSIAETYTTGRKLGKGGFAVCFEGTTQTKSEVFALKVVKAKVEQKKMMEKFRTELQIHAKMQHPNIVEFYRAFTLDNYTYVVLELCPNGSLTDMVKARSCLSLPEVRRFMIQICGGVKYMHKRSVIHRDLKMGNIFIDRQMNLKIGDFGLAAVMADEQDRRTTLCGTPNYIAPEILSKSGTRGHDNKVDTWAVGVICYAMLMGTPPFQSKTQQEIYTKLKTLEYEWKIDSKNYIPQQAKDFVASCLNLVSTERPEMDDLVEHEFFSLGAIADTLDASCLRTKPNWLENADPRGDKVKPGYGVAHYKICREVGVGIGSDGRPRPAAGNKASISTLLEIEAENQQGCAPVVPLPEGVLYNAFSQAQAEWSLRQKYPLLPGKPKGRKIMVEVQDTEKLSKRDQVTDSAQINAVIPPGGTSRIVQGIKPVPSFAAQQRQQALPVRSTAGYIQSQSTKIGSVSEVSQDSERMSQGLLKARPIRATSVRVTRSTSSQIVAPLMSNTVSRSNTIPADLEHFAFSNATDVSRDHTAQSKRSDFQEGPTESRTTAQQPILNEYTSVSSKLTDSQKLDSLAVRALQPTAANDRHPKSRGKDVQVPRHDTKTDLDPASKPHIISTTDSFTTLKGTSANEVLKSLRSLHDLLSHRTSDPYPNPVGTTSRRLRARVSYPRVDKWVDYATRHGIAYILTDGTLGMILKSSEDNLRPSSCVIVRNAKAHTIKRARGLEEQFVPQGHGAQDVEFYEQCNLEMDMKRLDVSAKEFMLDLKSHKSQVAASNAIQSKLVGSQLERMREVALLDKFGKYMNKQIGDAECEIDIEPSMGSSEQFIHFYQRLGNVGVWRFADGGLQFNFPDHTKLTVYHDKTSRSVETLIDLVYLESKDAERLSNRGILTTEALERRGMMTLNLLDILNGNLRMLEADVVRTNEVKEKLSWIRAVLGCWIKEGGIGRMGEEKLGWGGIQERRDDKRTKLQWVTVGRLGGDGDTTVSKREG